MAPTQDLRGLHTFGYTDRASVLIDLIMESAGKLVVEPLVTVSPGFCLAASHDISYAFPVTALELRFQSD